MSFEVASCPTDIVNAPLEVVWGLLTEPSRWGEFYDVRILSLAPPGPAVAGQVVLGESGPRIFRLRISFTFRRVDVERHELAFDVRMPLGVTVREDLDCRPVDRDRCRVNYHCNFRFADGWRGRLTRLVLGRELVDGPRDSLDRLKRAAERRAAETGARTGTT
jgi:hypothetical protein